MLTLGLATALAARACRRVVALLCLACAFGCGPSYVPKKLEMEPIGTWKNVPTDTPDDDGDSNVTAPNSATAAALSGPCSAASFDDLEEALRQCEVPMPKASELAPLDDDKLEVRMTATPAQTRPGGRIDVQVTLRNKTADPLALYFTGAPTPRFDVEAVDRKGRRVDLPSTRWPGYPRGVKPEAREAKAARITLDPSGVARVRLSWDAVKTRWAPERAKVWTGRGHPRASTGPLGPGKYSLRLVLPLLGNVDVPPLPVSVAKG